MTEGSGGIPHVGAVFTVLDRGTGSRKPPRPGVPLTFLHVSNCLADVVGGGGPPRGFFE